MSTTISFQHINLEYLDTMTGGDTEVMEQMIEMLMEEIPVELDKMQQAVAEEDWKEVFQISHKFKMTVAYIGNKDMDSINKTIEHCTRYETELHEVPQLVEELTDLGTLVMDELRIAKL